MSKKTCKIKFLLIARPVRLRAFFAAATGIAFLFAASTQELRAASAAMASPGEKLHVLGTTELHAAVLASSAEAVAARKSVRDFLARSEVTDQIERMGFEPAHVASHTALLTDSEILRLNAQIMATDQQIRTAGLPGWAVTFIVISAVLVILVVVLHHYID